MIFFNSRYEALKVYPNAIIRKILNHQSNQKAGFYVAFNDWLTYEDWQRSNLVK
jgi:hypothetical protein